MLQTSKIRTLEDAIDQVADGDAVALGGVGEDRVPMAALREIVRQRRFGLSLVGSAPGMAMDLLAASGCATSVMPQALPGLRAAALGLSVMPLAAGESVADARPFTDPFTGQAVMAMRAIAPEIAILHALRADRAGNVQFPPGAGDELILARAAQRVIVTVEQVVSEDTLTGRLPGLLLPGQFVTCVAEAPYGAYPFGCDGRYTADAARIAPIRSASRDGLSAWLAAEMDGVAGHLGYLGRVGARALMAISLDRSVRA